MTDHCLAIDQALYHANREAILPVKKRDMYCLEPQDTLLVELDPTYQGLLFLDCSPETPDLLSIIEDSIDPTIKERIIITVKQSIDQNQRKV